MHTQEYKKIPNRWGRLVVCKTVERKQDFLKICDQRGDELAAAVRLRIDGAISDLHAVGFVSSPMQYSFSVNGKYV